MGEAHERHDHHHGCSFLPEIGPDHTAYSHVPEHGFSLFLAERTKVIHFVRHAEGHHNEAIRNAGSDAPTIYSTQGSEKFLDARLNDVGKQQCKTVREEVIESRHAQRVKPEVIIVSPLTRTLETAHLLFGNSKHPNSFIVHNICRERWGKYMNDKRRKASEIRAEFEHVYADSGDLINFDDFAFPSEADEEWTEERESDEHCSARGIKLLQWLNQLKEREIAVVTHSSFLRHLFKEFGSNLSQIDRSTLQAQVMRKSGRSHWLRIEGEDRLLVPNSCLRMTCQF